MSTFRPVLFLKEKPLLAGEYLIGVYAWTFPVTLVSAAVICFAPQVGPVTLELEVDGNLTGVPVTLNPVVPGNQEMQTTAGLGKLGLVAGQKVRWKVTSAPAPEFSAWKLTLTLQIVY